MSEILRYGISMDFAKCHIKENGDVVSFKDYEATRKELEELQDYLCDYFAMEAMKSPGSIIGKAVKASQDRTMNQNRNIHFD